MRRTGFLLRHLARSGPTREAPHVHGKCPMGQWGDRSSMPAAARSTDKFSEISEALRILGGIDQVRVRYCSRRVFIASLINPENRCRNLRIRKIADAAESSKTNSAAATIQSIDLFSDAVANYRPAIIRVSPPHVNAGQRYDWHSYFAICRRRVEFKRTTLETASRSSG